MEMDRYLRNRPFLIIKVSQNPARGVKTEQKGWTDRPGAIATHEQNYIVDRVTPKLIREASVIIDILNKTCVVNNVYPDTDKATLVEYFISKHPGEIAQALDVLQARLARAEAAKQTV